MKKIIFVLTSCWLLAGCVNNHRISSYMTIKERCGIDEILQSNFAVLDSKDVGKMVLKEIELRIEAGEDFIKYYKEVSMNGAVDIRQNDDFKKKAKKMEIYFMDIYRIIQSGLLIISEDDAERFLNRMNSYLNNLEALDEKIDNATYDFSPLYQDGDAKNEIPVDLNNYLNTSDGTDWNSAKLTARAANILKSEGIYHSKAKGCWVIRKKRKSEYNYDSCF